MTARLCPAESTSEIPAPPSARRLSRRRGRRSLSWRSRRTAPESSTPQSPRGTPAMTPLPAGYDPLDGTVELLDRDPRLREVVVFETAHDAQLRSVNNILRIHT